MFILLSFYFPGSRLQANKYIQQFTEIFTEEGRKSVRIKHIVPGQLPRVSFTGGMREMVRDYFWKLKNAINTVVLVFIDILNAVYSVYMSYLKAMLLSV